MQHPDTGADTYAYTHAGQTAFDPLADLDALDFQIPEETEAAGDAVDPVLLDIFRSEAARNLGLVREWLDQIDPDQIDQSPD